ncbi:AraC family transcriptional regulator [Catenibacterium sp. AM22-15]|uniref:AraC family transcriptional regulator n=1 Tax=unclassified Catenibacterium TaxID=2643636 RepID=UPI000E3EE90C|nr:MULTISPECIES: AraC family transcriptional regulator [unclassified Catenibacterium]RGF00228.1 AraC family transcriptional regulator [Catenibacterium sp. AM22-6LB]RGF08831.1 AraC family transcriptional regulator [Catenibacterium sp. AM22-15]
MIETFLKNIDYFYETTKIPIFILNSNNVITACTQDFFKLPKDCFKHLLKSSIIKWKKIGILNTKSDIIFFIKYKDNMICIGPMLLNSIYQYRSIKQITFFNFLKTKPQLDEVQKKCTTFNDHSFTYIQIIYHLLTNDVLTIEDIRKILHENKQSESKDDLEELKITKREYTNQIYTFLDEQKFLKYIHDGDSISARTLIAKLIKNESELLSNDKIQSTKYKIVSIVTLITRQVIETGVHLEDAYGLSDVCIRKVDTAQDMNRLNEVLMRTIIDFCTLVKKNLSTQYPLWTRTCIEYINQNLHRNISLDDIASEINMNGKYVSVQFKKITGEGLVEYINRKKIEESQFLLINTKLSILEISTILNYTDQSHFTKIFKKYTKMTPKQYRNMY